MRYKDAAQLEYEARDLPACEYCGVDAGKVCLTSTGNPTQSHMVRVVANAELRIQNHVVPDAPVEPLDPGKYCTAQLHNLSNDNVWHHDCWLEPGHEGFHECHHHNRQRERGCLWVTGQFVRDTFEEKNEPQRSG